MSSDFVAQMVVFEIYATGLVNFVTVKSLRPLVQGRWIGVITKPATGSSKPTKWTFSLRCPKFLQSKFLHSVLPALCPLWVDLCYSTWLNDRDSERERR